MAGKHGWQKDLIEQLIELGGRVQREREARGWSKEHLASRCKLPATKIRGVETGAAALGDLMVAMKELGWTGVLETRGKWARGSEHTAIRVEVRRVTRKPSDKSAPSGEWVSGDD